MRPKKFRIDPAMLDGVNVPILILDPVWLAYFRDTGDERILALQAEVKGSCRHVTPFLD